MQPPIETAVTATNPDGTTPPAEPSAPITPTAAAAATLTLAAAPTSVLYGGTVQLSGRLQQADTAAGVAGETVAIERRPKGTTWTTLTMVVTASDGTLDPAPQVAPLAHTDYRFATSAHRSMPLAPAQWPPCGLVCA